MKSITHIITHFWKITLFLWKVLLKYWNFLQHFHVLIVILNCSVGFVYCNFAFTAIAIFDFLNGNFWFIVGELLFIYCKFWLFFVENL